jgi:hypothetical protein
VTTMADNDFADLEDLVRRDISAGLAGGQQDSDGAPFTALATDRNNGDGIVYANAITGGAFTAVEWAFECEHTGPFGGIPTTYRTLTIYGVTIVRTRGEKVTFRRYVDWSAVMAELGVTASFRPAYERMDEIPNINMSARKVKRTSGRVTD